MKFTTLNLAGSLALTVDAFWRMECPGRVGLARIDPLISPGEPSAHVHSIHGSSGFHESATYDDLVKADCTSCAVEQDKSAYWHPSVFFEDAATGKFEVVQQKGGMLAYYLLFKNAGEDKVTAFPKGFRMIAGDSTRRNYSDALGDVSAPDPEKSLWSALGQTNQADLAQRALGFNCLNYAKQPEGSLYRHFIPDKDYLDANCANGLRFELMFPSCWNGKDLDSTNHRDHVAYPDLVMTGTCPKSHPVRLISLFYETIWDTYAFLGRPGRFVVANGDVRGFGYHGDFMTGWDEAFLQQAADTCTNESGRIQDCPLFTIQSEDKARQCEMNRIGVMSTAATENTTGPGLGSLPGNVAIQMGPGPAMNANPAPAPATSVAPAPTLGYQPGTTASGETYYPGQVFHGAGDTTSAVGADENRGPGIQAAPTETSASEPPPPPPPAPTSEEVDGTFSAVSTQYITVGNVVSKIVWAEDVVYVTEYDETTSTVTVSATSTIVANARARRHLRHLREHAHHHY